jgi:23S rRNA pseudouridine2604 synthase
MTDETIWLNKFISESGFCSRREADKLIIDGQVTINGTIANKGDEIKRGDKVRINGKLLKSRLEEEVIFIALNKPVGIVSTTENVRDNIVQFVNHPDRIFPIGRLDKDSQGLIFLTNNGDLVNKILRAGNNHEKEYIVTVDKALTDVVISGLSKGVPIMGTVTKKCKVTREGVKSFRITLIQGLNRQIRRMCEYFGYEVVKLERIRIMNIRLKGIPLGEWRDLTDEEMEEIHQLTKGSSSDYIPKDESKEIQKKKKFGKKPFKKFIQDGQSTQSSFHKDKFADKKSPSASKDKTDEKTKDKKSTLSRSKKANDSKFPKPPSGKRIGKSRPKVDTRRSK